MNLRSAFKIDLSIKPVTLAHISVWLPQFAFAGLADLRLLKPKGRGKRQSPVGANMLGTR